MEHPQRHPLRPETLRRRRPPLCHAPRRHPAQARRSQARLPLQPGHRHHRRPDPPLPSVGPGSPHPLRPHDHRLPDQSHPVPHPAHAHPRRRKRFNPPRPPPPPPPPTPPPPHFSPPPTPPPPPLP